MHPGLLDVLEHSADATQKAPAAKPRLHEGESGFTLPTVALGDGTSADVLETALGTAVRFTRKGVGYVVAGSVTRATAESAARGL